MIFCAAEQGGPSGSAANADAAAAAAAAASSSTASSADQPIDFKAKLLSLLGLDDTADAATIDAKIAEVSTTMGSVGDLTAKASTAEELQKKYDDLQLEWQALSQKQQEIDKQQREAQADEILAAYKDQFVDEAAMAPIRNILINDKEAGILILNGLKKPAAAAEVDTTAAVTKTATPPPPQHDPNAAASGPDEAEIASKVGIRAKELRVKFPKMSNADLFAQAEKEIRKELSAATSA